MVVEGKTVSRAMDNEIGRKLLCLCYGSVILSHRGVCAYSFDYSNQPINYFLSFYSTSKKDIHRSGISDKSPKNNI